MTKEIPLQSIKLNRFIADNRCKVLACLRKRFSLSDDDFNDVFQNSSIALFLNIRDGKLKELPTDIKLENKSSKPKPNDRLFPYFLGICINQTLKLISKHKKNVPLFDDSKLTNDEIFRQDKIDELYQLCTEDEEAEQISQSEKIVQDIIAAMPDTCKNIFQGYYWDNLTTTVIADMFGFANANSVKTQKYKCLQKFRNKYNELTSKIYG